MNAKRLSTRKSGSFPIVETLLPTHKFLCPRLFRVVINARLIVFIAASLAAFSITETRAGSFDCNLNCNLFARESYPNFVIGTVRAVATDEEAREVFRFAKTNDYWSQLPDDSARFIELVQLMSIVVPEGGDEIEMSLLLSREEFDASPLQPGDFVRYTRHLDDEPMTPLFKQADNRPYWDVFGCIAVLCSRGDSDCQQRYSAGIYRFEDGVQLDRLSKTPLEKGSRIDTGTMLPLVVNQNTGQPHQK